MTEHSTTPERKMEDIRVVMVFGQDTTLGQTLVPYLESQGIKVVPRSTDHDLPADISSAIKKDIQLKRPDVVVNCLLDPDPSQYPTDWVGKYLIPTHSILQECRDTGIRLIQCSSAQLFGPYVEPFTGYSEYDPALCVGANPWRPILHAMENMVWQQTSVYNAAAVAGTAPEFECYMLRIGELLTKRDMQRPDTRNQISLSNSLKRICEGEAVVVQPAQHQFTVSPIQDVTVCKYIASLVERHAPIPTGTYHLGSSHPASLAEIYTYVSKRTASRSPITIPAEANRLDPLVGVDGYQGMDTSLLNERFTTMRLPRWKHEVDKLLGSSLVSF